MEYKKGIEFINIILVSVVAGLFFYFKNYYKVEGVVFNCVYPNWQNKINEPIINHIGKVLRNPFFYPVKDVNVKMIKVDNEIKQVAKEANPPLVYKGMMLWGDEKVAIFYIQKEKKTKFVKLGEFVNGYKVLDISEDEVVLSKEGGLSIVTLKIGGVRD